MNITRYLMKYWDAIDTLKFKMQNNNIKSKKNLGGNAEHQQIHA